MGDVEKLLDQLELDGSIDSRDRQFTINFAAAQEKLARFCLLDSSEIILRFVQAANHSAESLHLESNGNEQSVILKGWDPTLSIDRVVESLTSSQIQLGDDALGYLFIALVTLLKEVPDGVRFVQRIKGKKFVDGFAPTSSREIHRTASKDSNSESTLEIYWPLKSDLSMRSMETLLKKRCAFSAVPIFYQGEQLKAPFPELSDEVKVQYFSPNEVVGRYHQAVDGEYSNLIDEDLPAPQTVGEDSERFVILRLTPSQNRSAVIWLMKSGVLIERRAMGLGVSGVVGVVNADDLTTDVTGGRFIENETLDALREDLRGSAERLLSDALANPYELHPTFYIKPMRTKHLAYLSGFILTLCYVVVFIVGGVIDFEFAGVPERLKLTLISLAAFFTLITSLVVAGFARKPIVRRAEEKRRSELVTVVLNHLRGQLKKDE